MAQAATRSKTFAPAKEHELDQALAYLKEHEQHRHASVDRHMLKTMFNATNQEREPKSKLPLLTATVIRKHIAARDKGNVRLIEAYTSGVMKMFSIRSTFARRHHTRPTTAQPANEHPVEKNGQLVLL